MGGAAHSSSSAQVEPIRLRALSLAGVQSTTLAVMAAHGEVGPMPDYTIFAEADWEPQAAQLRPTVTAWDTSVTRHT